MIPFSSWSLSSSAQREYFTASYTTDFTTSSLLPTPYIAQIYDLPASLKGTNSQFVGTFKTIGTPSSSVYTNRGVYADIRMNNAYDVILLDTLAPPTVTTITTTQAPAYVTDNLLMYLDASNRTSYPFGEGINSIWYDLTGNGNNFTLYGPVYSPDSGGSVTFDGSNDTADLSGFDWRRNFTFELWVRFTNFDASRGMLGQGTGATNQAIYIAHDSSAVRYRMYFNDFDVNLTTSTNTWYQYVFTYNHSSPYTKQVYRNGVLVGQSGTQAQYAGTGTFRIGATYSSGITNMLNGAVGLFRGYGKILTAAEVLQNYDNDKTRFGL